jgi:undecaprenyl-diphosphatase
MMNPKSRLINTVIVFIAIFFLLEFFVLSGLIQKTDEDAFIVINHFGTPAAIDTIMILFSLYGREVVWAVVIILLYIKGDREQRKTAILMIMLFLILTFLAVSSKILNNRQRPYEVIQGVDLLVSKESDTSFPSGHALIVSGGATLLWLRERKRWAIIAAFEAALVSFSRVYVGVHYPSDVVGGILLGVIFAILLVLIDQKTGFFKLFLYAKYSFN